MRGQSPSGSQLGNRSLRRCKSKSKSQSNVDVDVVIVDVDHDVVIVDAPETSEQGSRRSRERRRQPFPGDAIHIVDVDGDIDDTPRNAHGDYAGKAPVSSYFPSTEESDSDECLMFVPERDFPSKSASKKRIYCKNNSSRNRYGFFHGSESDSSDCEILDDSSGNIREQWEVASLRKGKPVKNRPGSDEQANACGSFADSISSSPGKTHNKVAVKDQLSSEEKVSASGSCADPISSSIGKTHNKVAVKDQLSSEEKASASGSCADPISSSPGRTCNKVAVGSLKNEAYLNHRENVAVDETPNNGNEKASSSVPSVDIMTEKSPVETGAFGSDSDSKFSSPKTSHDKVVEENFTNTISLNDCEDVAVDKSIGNPNNGENKTFNSVPTADIITDKSSPGTSAFGSFANSKTTHVQVDADLFPNKGYSSNCTDGPVENSRSKSTNGKENGSSNAHTADNLKETPPSETNANNTPSRVSATDKLTEEPSLKTDANTCFAESNPICGVYGEPGLQNEGMTSEKKSHGAQSTDGTPFDHKTTTFSDVKVPLWVPSSCNSRLHYKHYVANFRQKDQIPGEPSCDTESWCSIKVEHEVFDFQGKRKSVMEPSINPPSINPQSNEPEHNAPGGCVNCNKEPSLRGPISNHHEHSGIPEHNNAQGDCVNCNKELTLVGPICDHHEYSGIPVMDHSSDKASEHLDLLHENMIGERERHKESDEYKRAAEEEWASRLQQLQIQAAEVQQLRRKRKAEKAVLDMEKRQKLRLEEIRESQKKDEETSNLKEKLRADVRKELDQMELRYRDMASLLRGLGIHVEGGTYPVSREVVNAAYKRALLKFHPDRSSQMDIRQQVEAEEKFKLILRMKKKLLL